MGNTDRTYRTGMSSTGMIHKSSAGGNGADCNNIIARRPMYLSRIADRTIDEINAAGRVCKKCFPVEVTAPEPEPATPERNRLERWAAKRYATEEYVTQGMADACEEFGHVYDTIDPQVCARCNTVQRDVKPEPEPEFVVGNDRDMDILVAFKGWFSDGSVWTREALFASVYTATEYARTKSAGGYERIVMIDGRVYRRFRDGDEMGA